MSFGVRKVCLANQLLPHFKPLIFPAPFFLFSISPHSFPSHPTPNPTFPPPMSMPLSPTSSPKQRCSSSNNLIYRSNEPSFEHLSTAADTTRKASSSSDQTILVMRSSTTADLSLRIEESMPQSIREVIGSTGRSEQ